MSKELIKQAYHEKRKDYIYINTIKSILHALAAGTQSILDVGSNQVDVISDLNITCKAALDIRSPLKAPGIESIKMNWFDFDIEKKFDIVCCYQVLEHIHDVEKFTQKLFDHANHIVFISVPYRWEKGSCKSHIHDPVDEEKLYRWTGRSFSFACTCRDKNLFRLLAVYDKNEPSAILQKVLRADVQ